MLSFAAFKQKLTETRAKIARLARPKTTPTGLKVSSTQKRKWRRSMKTRARAACDSFRYKHKHQHELRRRRKAAQRSRGRRPTHASTALRIGSKP